MRLSGRKGFLRALENWRSWEDRNAVEKFMKVRLLKGGCGVGQFPRNGS